MVLGVVAGLKNGELVTAGVYFREVPTTIPPHMATGACILFLKTS